MSCGLPPCIGCTGSPLAYSVDTTPRPYECSHAWLMGGQLVHTVWIRITRSLQVANPTGKQVDSYAPAT
ncbi:hypothetical protein PanWU01x14_367420 [Parasponia andersonii]|uniref:Uncharacterized protein n=1 Tax=Parasponia andersonii TaxID=3476 RepID=A0A2P5A5C1_PARAD|nr:hypothetical protein PanWU01x14_367420 [Parasponia andersonii]